MTLIRLTLLLNFLILNTFGVEFITSRIVGGIAPDTSSDNPAVFNAVAFIKTSTNKVFCSGSLIAQDIVITAKHCLVDKKREDFKVFLGQNDNDLSSGHVIEPADFAVRYPTDWDMFFPSFDIAWVKLSKPAPAPFKPLPFLRDPKLLKNGDDVLIAGFGNQARDGQSIVAGELLFKKTQLSEYLNNERYYNILFFKGDDENGGTCHGDSGGPSYARIGNQWYILGVANGFDPIITTEAMPYLGDPEFPYSVSCEKNESLYSFVAAHQNWLEETSGHSFHWQPQTNEQDREKESLPTSLKSWCEQKSIGTPTWNTLRHILTQYIDTIPQKDGKAFYFDCNAIVKHLESIESFAIDFSEISPAKMNLMPLSLLPQLKRVTITNTQTKHIDLNQLKNLRLDRLSLINNEIDSLNSLKGLSIKELSVSNQPLKSLDGINKVSNLEKLSLSRLDISDITPLENLSYLKDLSLTSVKSNMMKNLDKLTQLESINLMSTKLSRPSDLLKLVNLKQVQLNATTVSNLKILDLSELNKLEVITLRNANIPVKWPKNMSSLVSLTHTSSLEKSLDFLGNCSSLERINMFNSAIENVSYGLNCQNLQRINLKRTPINKDRSIRNSNNCPLSKVNEHVIHEFCAS